MNRNELKKFVVERNQRKYEHPEYQILGKFPLYDPEYQMKNPNKYIYLHSRNGENLQPVRLSKSFSLYNTYDILAKMQHVATKQNMIVAPLQIFHWKRREKLKKQYADFRASEFSYLILPEALLTPLERRKFIDFLLNLEWHSV